jgi:hypothetical protein
MTATAPINPRLHPRFVLCSMPCLAGDDRSKKNTCTDDPDESAPVKYKIEPYLFSIP